MEELAQDARKIWSSHKFVKKRARGERRVEFFLALRDTQGTATTTQDKVKIL